MRIGVRTRHLPRKDGAAEGKGGVPVAVHVERRVLFALGRFAHEIESVSVVIDDVNGPRGGADKRCALTARGPRIGTVFVEQTATDAYGAVDLLGGRAGRSIARALGRLREPEPAPDPRKG